MVGVITAAEFLSVSVGTEASQRLLGLSDALHVAGFPHDANARELLKQIPFQEFTEHTFIPIVICTVHDLAISDVSTDIETVRAAALARGWTSCPFEVAPQLRLQYSQQKGDCITVMTDQISHGDHNFDLFRLTHDAHGERLTVTNGMPRVLWSWKQTRLAFRVSR